MPSIGRVFTENKRVIEGSHEYNSLIEVNETNSLNTGSLVFGWRDSLDITFDNDLILNDLNIRNVGGSSVGFELVLLYPNGGSLPFTNTPVTNFLMNIPGGNNNWYQIPKWARLRVSITSENDGVLYVSTIGRCGKISCGCLST